MSARLALGIAGGVALIHLGLAASTGLAEDEAYYWVWSQHLAAGYYDHPPAIAWLIAAGTALAGDTELGVRLLPALLGSLGLLPAALLSPRPALAALALVGTPLVVLGGALASPDAPLLAAWALGLWAAAGRRWALLGVAAGLAMLSKYTGVLLLPLCLLAWPRDLRTRGPWLAALVALLVYAPNALWNVQHDLVSWRFQLGHAAGTETAAGAGSLAFLGAQAGLVGPLGFLAALAWLGARLPALRGEDRLLRLCWWTSAPVLALATVSGGEANWGAPAWVGLAVGLSAEGGRWPRLVGFAAGTSALLAAVAALHFVRPLADLPGDPAHRLVGGRVLADSVAAWGAQPVLTTRYQEAARIQFYSGIPAWKAPGVGRTDQYDLWTPPFDLAAADRLLLVRPWRGDAATPLDAQGWQRSGPNTVTAYAETTDPLRPVVAARWQVYEAWRPAEAP